MTRSLEIATPRWAVPLLSPARYKGAKGGRGSGKSHFFAEYLVEEAVADRNLQAVCIREIQKSLKFSAKRLIETKIEALGVSEFFDINQTEIRRKDGRGVIIFQGMQDHTADSIKSLEGFRIAWVEEAQNLSDRSMRLLRPTIREQGSEIWFSWNPEQPTDAVERLFKTGDDCILVHVNYTDNPFLPDTLLQEARRDQKYNPDSFGHVWLGEYNKKADAQVFYGKWRVDEFEPDSTFNGPYQGLDFGFAQDPTAAVRCWVKDNRLFISHEAGGRGLDIDKTAAAIDIPDYAKYATRADSARPESISYLQRHGLPRLEAVKKWQGSVQDGVAHIRGYDEVIIHERCQETAREFRLYSHKIDKQSGDILPDIVDEHNHYIDAIRYAIQPLIKRQTVIFEAL